MAPGPLARRLLRAPTWLYRWHLGWLLGHRFLMLTHVGRRTGRHHQVVVEVVRFDRIKAEAVVMAGFGPTSDWYRNVVRTPPVEVMVGAHRFQPTVRLLGEEEAAAAVADYEHRNRWAMPVIRAVLTRLVGWPYDGSDEARRRLVRQRPLVAFSPAPPQTAGAQPGGGGVNRRPQAR